MRDNLAVGEKDLKFKYLKLMSNQYKTISEASTEIINLEAILNLPKGTEHFLSDIHGEHEPFIHVLKNVEGIAFSTLTSEDVVRHPLVQRIVNAYEKDEERKKKDKYANRHSMGSEGTNKSGLRKNHSGYRGGRS